MNIEKKNKKKKEVQTRDRFDIARSSCDKNKVLRILFLLIIFIIKMCVTRNTRNTVDHKLDEMKKFATKL